MPYLITGATGPVGRSLVSQLRTLGHDVRIITRDLDKVPEGVDAVQGDFTKGNLPRSAFDDVKCLFLFPAYEGVDAFLKQAEAAGVEHIVVLSSLTVATEAERDDKSWGAQHHLAIESSVKSTGIPYTILRPGTFANNLLYWAHSIQTTGTIYAPYANSAQALIHEADIAAVAVVALTQNGHEGKAYPLTGPQALTQIEQLNCIGAAIGKQLRFQEISPEAYQEAMAKYMPASIIKMRLHYWQEAATNPEVVLPTVEQLTSYKARTLMQWANDHASDFAPRA